jgi:hypothetical protein
MRKKISKKSAAKKIAKRKKREVVKPGSMIATQHELSREKIAIIQSKFDDLKKKNKKEKIAKKDAKEIKNNIAEMKNRIAEINTGVLNLHDFNDYEILDAIADDLTKLKTNIEFKLQLFRRNFAKKELERIFS